MSRPRGYKHGKLKPSVGDKARKILENIDENNHVVKMFLGYRKELDEKHDRYEKIVKINRDITIENKRIIFLLHSTSTDIESKRQVIFEEAITRLKQVVSSNFKVIAAVLRGFDAYQYLKAYTSGLQEFIEALIFYQFLSCNTIYPWSYINENFQFEEEGDQFNLLFPQIDYILGFADFTGELMRRCINNLGIGNIQECFHICDVVRNIYTGFLGIILPGNKEFGRKLYVLKQSLSKMELVCYNVQLRGSEIPKHMLVNVIDSEEVCNEDDDAYF